MDDTVPITIGTILPTHSSFFSLEGFEFVHEK